MSYLIRAIYALRIMGTVRTTVRVRDGRTEISIPGMDHPVALDEGQSVDIDVESGPGNVPTVEYKVSVR